MRNSPVLKILFGLILAVPMLATAAVVPADLQLVRWPDSGTSFSQPIAFRAPNDGSGRVFVIERCGSIRVVKNGSLLATPFLSVSVSCGGEQGILGLAFDPNYASNGTFYVSYSAPNGDPALGSSNDHVLARYTASPASSDTANPTGQILMRVPDIANNHNGGDLHFGPDSFLYWSIGDGGVQNDPNGFAQCTGRKKANSNPATCRTTTGSGPNYYLLGKILRLDVHNTTASATNLCGVASGQPALYAIPAGNPFANAASFPDDCAEIFNWGFRNPFRFSFDRVTGDMLIGDVGQNRYEEVSFQAAGSGGQNFQWNQCEGLHTFPGNSLGCTGPAGSVAPRLEYSHSSGISGCSITGGYTYRGPIGPLRGQHIFSDYCSSGMYVVANAGAGVPSWTYETLGGASISGPIGFGEDANGNLFVGSQSGNAYIFYSDKIFENGFDN